MFSIFVLPNSENCVFSGSDVHICMRAILQCVHRLMVEICASTLLEYFNCPGNAREKKTKDIPDCVFNYVLTKTIIVVCLLLFLFMATLSFIHIILWFIMFLGVLSSTLHYCSMKSAS